MISCDRLTTTVSRLATPLCYRRLWRRPLSHARQRAPHRLEWAGGRSWPAPWASLAWAPLPTSPRSLTRSGPLVSIAEVLPPAIPAPAEAPELLALGRELDRLTAVYIEAAERQARAIELFNQLAPAVPDDLLHDPGKSMLWRTVLACEVRGGRQGYFTKAHQAFVLSEEECDLHGKRPYLDLPCRRSRAPLSVKQGGDVDSVLVARRRHRTRRACSKP
jgi:hypothetical protein